jgi:prepilin-type N-terminal cleavage/methylation domain-containing protein
MQHKKTIREYQAGFTLIEMIVSLGIFASVMTIAVGSLLVLISNNQKLQGEQSVMTNLAFALDGMTREIRTGTNYFCEARTNYNAGGSNNIFDDDNSQESVIGDRVDDCESINPGDQLHGVSFYEAGNSILGDTTTDKRILYFFDKASSTIKRRVGDEPAQAIVASGLKILDAQFIVTGTATSGDAVQPTVTIFIEAKEPNDDSVYRLQTTVTQRVLDL